MTTTAQEECAPSNDYTTITKQFIADEDSLYKQTFRRHMEARQEHIIKQKELAEKKEQERLDKLNDKEYIHRQYNMPLNDREFVDWLRGAVDLVGDEPPTKEQWDNIKTGIARVIAKRMLDTKEVEYVRGQVYKNPYTVTSTNPYANTVSAMSVAYNNANIGEWMVNKGPGI